MQWIISIAIKTDVEEYMITWTNETFYAYTFYIFGKQDNIGSTCKSDFSVDAWQTLTPISMNFLIYKLVILYQLPRVIVKINEIISHKELSTILGT